MVGRWAAMMLVARDLGYVPIWKRRGEAPCSVLPPEHVPSLPLPIVPPGAGCGPEEYLRIRVKHSSSLILWFQE